MSIIEIKSEEHWHELRKKHIGGSEVAALFGYSPYLTQLELWLIKRGEIPGDIKDNERMFWGRHLEEAIAQGVKQTKGWDIENPKAYFTCDDTPGMGCTPDRIISASNKKGLLQIKNVDRLEFMKWEEEEVPLKFQLQLQHELACTPYIWGVLAVLVGGNELHIFEFDKHERTIKKIKAAINQFWESLRTGEQPKAVAEDYEILKNLESNGEILDLSQDNYFTDLCAQHELLKKQAGNAEKEYKACKAAILQKIGTASGAKCNGFEAKKTTVFKKEYTVKATSYNQLTLKEIN